LQSHFQKEPLKDENMFNAMAKRVQLQKTTSLEDYVASMRENDRFIREKFAEKINKAFLGKNSMKLKKM
jgi:hypothetical protein